MNNINLSECIAPDFRAVHSHIKKEEYTEYWFRGGRGCFHGDQLVQTYEGPVKIKDIEKGDLVYTLNEKTQQFEIKNVIETFTYTNVKETFEVILKSGEKIVATGDHKFFQVGGCDKLKHLLYLTCKQNKGSIYVRRMEDDTELFEVRSINERETEVSELCGQRRPKWESTSAETSPNKGWVLAYNAEERYGEIQELVCPPMDCYDVSRAYSRGGVGSEPQEWDQGRQLRGEPGTGYTVRERASCNRDRASSGKERGGLQLRQTEERTGDRDTQDCRGTGEVLQQEAAGRTIRSNRELYKGCSNPSKKFLERLLDVDDIVSFREVKVEKVYDLSVRDNHNYILSIGKGVIVHNSTKSSFISVEIILAIIKNPEINVVVFRRYENEIRDSVFGQLTWAINKLGVEGSFKFQVSPFKIIYVPTGQQIIFKGADNPLKIKSINLGKGYIGIGWWEECDQFGGMEEIRNILQSIFRGTNEKQIALFSYNPPKSARSWVNAETRVEKSGRFVHYSDYRSVPPEWLGTTFLTNAEHLKRTNFTAYEHEYLGKEVGTGLEVFNNVTLRPITDGEIAGFDNYYQGLDFGFAADPLAFIQMHFDKYNRRLYLFFEISGTGIKNSVFVEKLTEEQKTDLTMADKAEPKSITELKEDYGMNIMGAEKGPGSIEHGIKWLQDLNEIIIDPERCPLAGKEFINYALKMNREGEVISKYPDKENHVIDSARYGCVLLINQARLEKKKGKKKTYSIPIISRWNK